MSRSFRKTKVFGNCGNSEKKCKRLNNRMFRKKEKQAIQKDKEEDCPVDMNEIRSTWTMRKDGKHWWNSATKRYMSK